MRCKIIPGQDLNLRLPEPLGRLGILAQALDHSATGDHEYQTTPGANMQHTLQLWTHEVMSYFL